MPLRLEQRARRAWAVLSGAVRRFLRIDGSHWAGSFAFSAFFSLFPLIILFVTLASFFVDRESAGRAIVTYVGDYVPLDGEMRTRVFEAIAGVIQARERAGLVALLILVWAALQCFTTLVRVTNRAWGDEAYNWWRLPLRGMALLGVTAGAVLMGMAAPALARVGKSWLFPGNDFGFWVYALWGFVVPLLVSFLSRPCSTGWLRAGRHDSPKCGSPPLAPRRCCRRPRACSSSTSNTLQR
jgi:Ca2+-transporting ATPase